MSQVKKYEVKIDGVTKTYAALLTTAYHLLDLAKESEEGRKLNLQASAVFYAFSFEAYLNHVGQKELADWNKIGMKLYKDKLSILGKELGLDIDLGRHPFQVIIELFNLRNALAHGRTQEIDQTYETKTLPDRHSLWEVHEWEKLTIEKVESYRKNVRTAIENINASRKEPDSKGNLWCLGMRGREVSYKTLASEETPI